jgi:hypothetical protein
MTTNAYLISTQMVNKSLISLKTILEKAQNWALENKVDEVELLQKRLAPDMLPLVKQVQVASDNAKGMASRLAGIENPSFEDNETNIYELMARIDRTIEFVGAIPAENFEGVDNLKIVLPFIQDKYQTAEDYLKDYALPNFFFHIVTVYAILRNQGMPLGKMDYINGLNLRDL